ncbi:hypothetical protein U2F10_03855 [Leptothoe sp. EHU-05/26/07-4]
MLYRAHHTAQECWRGERLAAIAAVISVGIGTFDRWLVRDNIRETYERG